MARSHYENFPVASRLLAPRVRPHVAAVYAFARTADDIADEGTASAAERQERLGRWRDRVHRAAAGPSGDVAADDRDALIAAALGHSIRTLDLPVSLFDDLLSAFGQDTMTSRYASWADVFDYCRRSANPIGRLVLRIAGYRDDGLGSIVRRAVHGAAAHELLAGLRARLAGGPAVRPSRRADGVRRVRERSGGRRDECGRGAARMAQCIEVTRTRFDEGRAVCDGVRGRLRLELRFTWLGGARMLTKVERAALVTADRSSHARRRRCAGAASGVSRGGGGRARTRSWRVRPASTTRSSSFRPISGARSWRSGISAARWTMRWTRCRRRRAGSPGQECGSLLAGGAGAMLRRAAAGNAAGPAAAAPHRGVRSAAAAFDDVIDGVAMDLDTTRYATFDDLFEYCRRVASAVGLICIRIFGCHSPRACEYALNLGIALQLTNILRDVKDDLALGRVYLPLEDLREVRLHGRGSQRPEPVLARPGADRLRVPPGARRSTSARSMRGRPRTGVGWWRPRSCARCTSRR